MKRKWRGECIVLELLLALTDFSAFFEARASLGANTNICPKVYNDECQEELDLVIPDLSVPPALFCIFFFFVKVKMSASVSYWSMLTSVLGR